MNIPEQLDALGITGFGRSSIEAMLAESQHPYTLLLNSVLKALERRLDAAARYMKDAEERIAQLERTVAILTKGQK